MNICLLSGAVRSDSLYKGRGRPGKMAAGAVGVYDICVVGAGMIGSAAARHISKHSGVRVCLVGPSEPQVIFVLV